MVFIIEEFSYDVADRDPLVCGMPQWHSFVRRFVKTGDLAQSLKYGDTETLPDVVVISEPYVFLFKRGKGGGGAGLDFLSLLNTDCILDAVSTVSALVMEWGFYSLDVYDIQYKLLKNISCKFKSGSHAVLVIPAH